MYKNLFHTSQEIYYVSAAKTNHSVFREIIFVHCGNYKNLTDTLCGQNEELQFIKAGGIYI
jgi:hypothetical protein